MWFSPSRYFPKKFGAHSEKIDLHVHGKKTHSFYAFELMIHFLAEESFLRIHSDILLNLTPGI